MVERIPEEAPSNDAAAAAANGSGSSGVVELANKAGELLFSSGGCGHGQSELESN